MVASFSSDFPFVATGRGLVRIALEANLTELISCGTTGMAALLAQRRRLVATGLGRGLGCCRQ